MLAAICQKLDSEGQSTKSEGVYTFDGWSLSAMEMLQQR